MYVFIHKLSCWCCSSSLDGLMLVHKRKVGLLVTIKGGDWAGVHRWGGGGEGRKCAILKSFAARNAHKSGFRNKLACFMKSYFLLS